MKILVLGGTGFIGRNMVECFAANNGHEVHATVYKRPTYPCNGVVWHQIVTDDYLNNREIDLCDKDVVKEIINKIKPDIIIQCAATTSGSKDIVNNPAIHVTDNVVMNAYIFREAVKQKVKHVIFFSCTTMFSNGVVTEDSPIDIHPKYFGVAHTKLYNEKMCEFYSGIGDTKFTVIRHSNIYGPYDKYDAERSHFFGATVSKVEQAKDRVTVWGDGQEARDLLYVDDLCNFVEIAILNQKEKFELFNCGLGKAFPIHGVVQKIITASGKDISIVYDLSKPTIKTSLCLDCSKAKELLGWEPKISIEDGIGLTIDWYRKNKI